MWSFWPGFLAFVIALSSGFLNDGLLRLPAKACSIIAGACMVISIYSVINGVYHALITWEFINLLDEAREQNIHARRSGPALLLIQFWPFAAIIIGSMGTWIYYQILYRSRAMH